jgi:heme/copper-type cytochrome/quinol oxidase subunit 2
MVILIIILVVYLLSAYFAWRYIHIAYSKGGVWEELKPTHSDIFTVFCPVINTYLAVIGWLTSPKVRTKKNSKTYDKFFKVKRQ